MIALNSDLKPGVLKRLQEPSAQRRETLELFAVRDQDEGIDERNDAHFLH